MKTYQFLVVIFLLTLGQTSYCQINNIASTPSLNDTIPFVLTDHNNISIQAIVNDQDTIQLMFHTAASSVSLIEASTSSMSSIQWNQSTKVESWGGQSDSRISSHNKLKIGQQVWDSIPMWECKRSGPLTDGKCGPDLFSGKVVEINFDRLEIILHPELPKMVDQYEQQAIDNQDGMLFIDGLSMIGDSSFANRYLIHSGYGGTILYDDEFVATHGIGDQLKVLSVQELKDSYDNVIKVKKSTLPIFKIGNIAFNDIPVGFFEGAIGRQKMSVIGGNFLKRFNIILDADRKYIYLKSNGLKDLPYDKV